MHYPPLFSAARLHLEQAGLAVAIIAVSLVNPVFAQSDSDSSSHFGDRQTGKFGDPGTGHFGNPAAGEFDKYKLREPAPGTQAAGRVYNGKPPEVSPYLSLPTPKDAAVLPEAVSKKSTAAKRKRRGDAPR